ncbi:MAG TPA: hypothetical protein VG328_13985 [Stellaceae bacterium]|jgi:elongation factor G|nr:hypothetical protein [Stellaceae bacterium]
MPEPLIEIAVEPKRGTDRNKLLHALAQIAGADPSFRVATDAKSGQIIVSGTDEEHIETAIDRLKNMFGLDIATGAPQVAYRETITQPAAVDYTHKLIHGASGQFARVKFHFEPLPAASGSVFESKIVGGSIPEACIPGVEKGARDLLNNGVLAGFPVIGLKITLVDGAYHEVDSSALAFEIAARAAVREGLTKASAKLLEPIMKVEVTTPLNYARDVLGDLRKRRSAIARQDQRNDTLVIDGTAPLANLFGYTKDLAALTADRGTITMTFSHYAPVPPPSPGDHPFPPAAGMRA